MHHHNTQLAIALMNDRRTALLTDAETHRHIWRARSGSSSPRNGHPAAVSGRPERR